MSRNFLVAVICGLCLVGQALSQEDNFKCPDEFEGFYPHLYSCDKYWHCKTGKANLKLCGNGLAFNDIDPTYTSENCDYFHNVECGNRTELEEPISAPNCPRLYGTFPDPDDCTGFFNCRDGLSNRYSCAPGLAFDPKDRVCKWADQVKTCKKPSDTEEEGGPFKCPSNGPVGIFTKHAHPEDCRQYFVCISGTPREYGCPLGTVFKEGLSENDGKCSDPEDVPECSNYYGDLAFDKQDLVRAGVDPEAVGAPVAATRARVIPSRAPTQAPAPAPVRVQPQSNTVGDLSDEEDQPFDTELRIQDLPKPQPPNEERSRLRSRPPPSPLNAIPVTRTEPQANPASPAGPASQSRFKQNRFTLSAETTTTTTTTTTTQAPIVITTQATTLQQFAEEEVVPASPVSLLEEAVQSPAAKPAALPTATGERKPAKVKAGDDYYYYYYYYDDDEEAKPAAAEGEKATTA